MERHFELNSPRLALLSVNKTLLFNQDNMGLCRNGGHAAMVTDFLVCRRIPASFDEGFDKIKDFPLSLRELFQKVHFRLVLLTAGVWGVSPQVLLLHSNFYRVAFARNKYT